ncbi:hypothetical protein K439DRAFT_1560998 [Ramaria rubella]|nr:hypothetical protein K439DRAFT_1560998 [Ramaria rubella]
MSGSVPPSGMTVAGPSRDDADQPPPTDQSPTSDPLPQTRITASTYVFNSELEMMKTLIACTELSNSRVRKLNAIRVQRRLNRTTRNSHPVSDDEVEDPLPVVSSYMRPEHPPPPPTITITPPNSSTPISTISPSTPFPLPLSHNALGKRPADHPGIPVNSSPDTTTTNAAPKWSSLMSTPQNDTTPANFQTLPPSISFEESTSNELELDVMSIPSTILQMAHLRLFIPLSMLTTAILNKICNNDNLKFKKIPFGNGAGKQSLDESQFPPESSLDTFLFFQAYMNWLTIIDAIADPRLAVGWYEHHAKMPHDENFNITFLAWQEPDRQLCSQFMIKPFLVNPYHATYVQLFEHARVTYAYYRSPPPSDSQRSFHHLSLPSSRSRSFNSSPSTSYSSPSTSRYSPYDKE